MAKILMKQDKVTKNTIRFNEVLENETDVPVIGVIYMPKTTLKAMNWTEGKNITLTVTVSRSAQTEAPEKKEAPKETAAKVRRGRPAKKSA